jgi:hypothetical protein
MELTCNKIVELRNGKFGVVACFNEKPFQLVFDSFTTPIGRYNDELKNKNTNYDIVKVYDGSSVENVLNVFKKGFDTDGLELVWERKD